jgi:electron transfer flavoprotein alpha/beta subunit
MSNAARFKQNKISKMPEKTIEQPLENIPIEKPAIIPVTLQSQAALHRYFSIVTVIAAKREEVKSQLEAIEKEFNEMFGKYNSCWLQAGALVGIDVDEMEKFISFRDQATGEFSFKLKVMAEK